MTYQSPRIYTYKITFEEVPYYYYGVHKEKKFDEYYMGSPVTNKWCWKFYTPKKQILELFEYSDEGWFKAQEVECRLIRPVFNEDKMCLNENCGFVISLQILRKSGQKSGKMAYELGIGVHGLSKEQRIENGKKYGKIGGKLGGQKSFEIGVGAHARSKEEMYEHGKINGRKNYELGLGVHARSKEQMIEDGRKGGKISYERGVGVYSLSQDQLSKNGKKGAKSQHAQRWRCITTGFESTPTGLSHYQRKRGIDPSNRIRIH